MDPYTSDVEAWLNRRFRQTDSEGVYWAHQPIYGFRKGHCEPATVMRYMITYQIMRALAHLDFSTFLDVGGAEGYKAALVRSLFGAGVRSSDLASEACVRAREIFNVEGDAVDIAKLPYEDEQFDVVLCSETLEHVPEIERPVAELLRVSRRAVVITVPCESKATVERNKREKIPHAHIQSLNPRSFDFAKGQGVRIVVHRHHTIGLAQMAGLLDAMKRDSIAFMPAWVTSLYNASLPLLRAVASQRLIEGVIRLDDFLANAMPVHSGISVLLLKDHGCYSSAPKRRVTPRDIIDFHVPLHRLA